MGEPTGPIIVICGLDTDGKIRALEVTASDELKVALVTATGSDLLTELEAKLETADLEIVNDILSIGQHGWIDSAWQRNPLQLGYSRPLRAAWSNTDLPAGASYVDETAVPAGEIWVVEVYTFVYIGSTATVLRYAIRSSSVDYYISEVANPPNNIYTSIYPGLVLEEGDILRLRIVTASLHDKLYGYALGRIIDVDQ